MAKEQGNIKRVELKVNVNCCDGCRRKVLKALSVQGVLRTEVQPAADRVAVVGDVDSVRLVKRLAKVGKIAEVVVIVPQPPPEGERKKKQDGGGCGHKTGSKPLPANEKGNHDGENAGKPERGGDGKSVPKGAYAEATADDDATGKAQREAGRASTVPGGVTGGHDGKPATMAVCYHQAEPAMAVPLHLPCYAASCTMPAPPPPYGTGAYYYAMPPPQDCRRPPVVRPQPTRFADEDVFSDDNTVGCHVM